MKIQNKRTRQVISVTPDTWENMKSTQLDRYWNVLDSSEIKVDSNIEIETFLKKSAEVVEDKPKRKPKK